MGQGDGGEGFSMIKAPKYNYVGELIRVTTWTKDGTSTKTCLTLSEARDFIASVEARLSS